jgi:multidrug efflux pump subunit AcrA (membrane-fusion protein)
MTFADLSQLLIYSHVNQVDAPRLALGQKVEVNMTDTAEDPVKAHIEFIAPLAVVKNNIKGFEVQAAIDDTNGRLKPGMSVSMNVPVGKASHAVSVPVGAIFKEKKSNVVYVRKGESTEKRKVILGVNNLSFVEIKSGVNEGEEILLVEPSVMPAKS